MSTGKEADLDLLARSVSPPALILYPCQIFCRLFIGTGGPSGARGQVVTAGFYKAPESPGQFADPVLLATADGVRRHQFPSDTQGDGPRQDEIGSIVLIDAAGGY